MANMIYNGKLLYGNKRLINKLRRKAQNAINKVNEFDVIKYYRCWDAFDDYKACRYHKGLPYYNCLKYLIEAYLYNHDYCILPENKIERFFKDEEYRCRYNILKFPDNEFNKLVINCFDKPNRKNLEKLYWFVINDGNFDINNFELKSEL